MIILQISIETAFAFGLDKMFLLTLFLESKGKGQTFK